MAGQGISALCLADTCISEVHSVFNPVAPYGYRLCLCDVVRPGFVSISPTFMRSSASNPMGPHGRLSPKTVNWAPIAGAGF